jgi:hypothetical protein
MYRLNKNSSNYFAAALVLTAVITTTSLSPLPITSSIAIPAAATPTTGKATNTNTTTTTTTTASQPELSQQPVLQEQVRLESQTAVNNTHFGVIVSGSGTLTLPNGTEPIRVTSTKTGIVSLMEGAFNGKEVLTTEDGSESATSTFYEITRFNMESGEGRGIAIATFHTNSTGVLAPLNGMILTGIDELYPDQTGRQTLWEWQSGIPLPLVPPTTSPPPTIQGQISPEEQQQAAEEEEAAIGTQ